MVAETELELVMFATEGPLTCVHKYDDMVPSGSEADPVSVTELTGSVIV